MTAGLRAAELQWLSGLVADTLGLHYPQERWGDLEHQTNLAAQDLGWPAARALIERAQTAPLTLEQREHLAAQLTISETYFWREPRTLEALRDTILPGLIEARTAGNRTLRLWCAGCATGEEAYSLAFALREVLPDLGDWRVTLLASDVNAQLLGRAALGVYGPASFRDMPPELMAKYFQPHGDGQFEVLPEIRSMVSFVTLNLAEAIYPAPATDTHAMDIIFCRNVLMYFAPEPGRQAAQRLYRALAEDGWLLVAAAELSKRLFSEFSAVRFPGTFALQRAAPAAPEAAALPVVPDAPEAAAALPVVPDAPEAVAALPVASTRPRTARSAEQARETKRPSRAPAGRLTAAAAVLVVRDLANQGKLHEARAACERALSANKLEATLHYLHAMILTEATLLEDARAALKRALYLDSTFVLAHFALSDLAQRLGDRAAAKKSLNNTLALLGDLAADAVLPEAGGLTTGRLREIVLTKLQTGGLVE